MTFMAFKAINEEGYSDTFQSANNFNVWLGTSINQKKQFQSIPPYQLVSRSVLLE